MAARSAAQRKPAGPQRILRPARSPVHCWPSEAAARLPDAVARAPKRGFESPVATWFRTGLQTGLVGTIREVGLDRLIRCDAVERPDDVPSSHVRALRFVCLDRANGTTATAAEIPQIDGA